MAMDTVSQETIISRWWEEKARRALSCSTDVKEIELICRYVPFQDPSTARQILGRREISILEKVVRSLDDAKEIVIERKAGETYQTDREIRSLRLAEEITRCLEVEASSSPEYTWCLALKSPKDMIKASSINYRVSRVFSKVTFLDWIRLTVGYEAESFAKVLTRMSATSNRCRQFLKENPRLKRRYEKLEMELRFMHPWAHWLVVASLRPFDVTPVSADSSAILHDNSVELIRALTFLVNPIRALFSRRDQDLVEMLQDFAILRSRFLRDMVQELDWTKPLSTDFSFRRGIAQANLPEFAASITKGDWAHFDQLSSTDFETLTTGRLFSLDERLLKLTEDIKECIEADRDLIEPIGKVLKCLLLARNYASAMAVLAAVRGHRTNTCRIWKVVGNLGLAAENYWVYRQAYQVNSGLLSPTPHLRELESTAERETTLEDILRFKSYPVSRNEMPSLGIGKETVTTFDKVCLAGRVVEHTKQRRVISEGILRSISSPVSKEEIQKLTTGTKKDGTSDKLCLVCRDKESKYNGLRMKCPECYRNDRIVHLLTKEKVGVRKHAHEAVDDEERPAKRIQSISANTQDKTPQGSEIMGKILLATHNFSPFERFGAHLDITQAQHLVLSTPPATPRQHEPIFLPNIDEFEAEISRMHTEEAIEQSKTQQQPAAIDISRAGDEIYRPAIPQYYISLPIESLKKVRNLDRPSLPPPKVKAQVANNDSSLGEMFVEAAMAAGRPFYLPRNEDAVMMAVPSSTKSIPAPPSEPQNTRPSEPQAASIAPRVLHPANNEPVWWRIFPPPEPYSTDAMTTTTVPNVGVLQLGTRRSERPDGESFQSISQSKPLHRSTGLMSGFAPMNSLLSDNSVNPMSIIQHYNPKEVRFTTFAEPVQ